MRPGAPNCRDVKIWRKPLTRPAAASVGDICVLYITPVPPGNKKKEKIIVGHVLGNFSGTYYQIIGLKAPGNYSDRIPSNKLSNLLLERQKTNIFMISRLLDLWEPLFMDEYTRIFLEM